LLFVPKDRLEPVQGEIAALAAKVKAELQSVDPDVVLTLEVAAKVKKGRVVKRPQVKKVVQTLLALPHGVIRMSADIPGLVETSTNVATIATAQRSIRVVTSQRSSVASELDEVCQSVAATLGLGGAAVETGDGYPGWKPNLASPILKAAQEAYRKLYGKEPAVKAIHAGLECGIIGERYPGMDMVSAGPTLEAVHSPDEKIYIDTVDRFWQLVTTILRDVN
jgi:dipeptidase D